jgi:hypothetical protein
VHACVRACLSACLCGVYAYGYPNVFHSTLFPWERSFTEVGTRWTVSKPQQSSCFCPPPKSSTVVGLQMHMGILVFEMDAGNFNSYSYSYITHWTATLASFCLFLKISHLEQDRNSTFICHCNQKSSFTCPKSRYLGCNLASFTSWISYLCQWLLCRL